MNKDKFKREVLKQLNELRESILRVDYMGIKRATEKLKSKILILQGIQNENREKKKIGAEYNRDILRYPIKYFYDMLSMIEKIVEVKYPEETIYGKKIDPKVLKQKDLMEWYVLLEEGVKNAIECI